MLIRIVKIVISLAFLSRLTICHFWNATGGNETLEKNENETKEFPNLLMQEKEQEGVRLETITQFSVLLN